PPTLTPFPYTTLFRSEQVYRYNQGAWYGDPGVSMPHFEDSEVAGDSYAYAQGDYAAAYRSNTGLSNPAAELVRDVFYVRDADYVDRKSTRLNSSHEWI